MTIAYDAQNEEINNYSTERFGLLFSKHIYPKDDEKIAELNERFALLIEELKNPKEEIIVEIQESNMSIKEDDLPEI